MCLGFYLTSVSSDARCRSQHRMSASTFVSASSPHVSLPPWLGIHASNPGRPRPDSALSFCPTAPDLSGFGPFILEIQCFRVFPRPSPCRAVIFAILGIPPSLQFVAEGCDSSGGGGAAGGDKLSTSRRRSLSPKAATPPEEEEQPEATNSPRAGGEFVSVCRLRRRRLLRRSSPPASRPVSRAVVFVVLACPAPRPASCPVPCAFLWAPAHFFAHFRMPR
eukprot:jgi/Botrbrau1/18005/Bobra.0784s0001.1